MDTYFINAKVYKLQHRQVFSSHGAGHVTQFWCKYVKIEVTCK